MAEVESHLQKLQSLLQPSEIIAPESPHYQPSIQTWASQKQLHPRVVVRPGSVESLSKIVAHVYSTDLDFSIYGHGFMSASTQGVLINTSALDDFHFDKYSELVTIGAGQKWADVYRKLGQVTPDYGIVGARTPSVGVGGTIITGGFSWLSSEYGCISDPANMLDAKVVKYDGSVVWASAEPELLWALRGGGGGFGVIAQVVLRVFRYPTRIWAGPIMIPREQLPEVADRVARFVSQPVDPKITMLLYVARKKVLATFGAESDMVVLHVFDPLGEEHGRAEFRWALEMPGAIEHTKMMTLTEVAGLQDKLSTVKGTMKQFWSPLALRSISKETITKAVQWTEHIRQINEMLADCTFLIFILLGARDPAGPIANCAWPRAKGAKHGILLGTGCPSDAGPEEEALAKDLAAGCASAIFGQEEVFYLPNAFEEFHDAKEIWGPHFPRLQQLRRQYDPRGKFKAPIST